MNGFYHVPEGIAALSRSEVNGNLPKIAYSHEKIISSMQVSKIGYVFTNLQVALTNGMSSMTKQILAKS
jgi:hypothetical protein